MTKAKQATDAAIEATKQAPSGLIAGDDNFTAVLSDAYDAQDGIVALKEAIAEKQTAISERLMELAKHSDSAEQFLEFCKRAEEGLKAARKARNLPHKLPTTWTQAKSNIKQGWIKFGLNPAEYETESSFRKAKTAASNAAQSSGGASVTEKADAAEIDAVLRDKLNIFLAELKKLGDKDTDAASDVLEVAIKAVKAAGKLQAELPNEPIEGEQQIAANG